MIQIYPDSLFCHDLIFRIRAFESVRCTIHIAPFKGFVIVVALNVGLRSSAHGDENVTPGRELLHPTLIYAAL
jgi:hypothetical protein